MSHVTLAASVIAAIGTVHPIPAKAAATATGGMAGPSEPAATAPAAADAARPASPSPMSRLVPTNPATLVAIEAACFDYIDGQLEGDAARVARVLHPDLAKRAVLGETTDEKLGLRRMGKEELVELTRKGVLKTPPAQWDRSCEVLDVAGETAAVRAETPWFVDFFHLGKFGDRWLIVNALWHTKQGAR